MMNKEQIKELISKMSLREKIGQLNQEMLEESRIDAIKEGIRKGDIGSVILSATAVSGNDQMPRLDINLINELERIAVEESNLKIPVIFGRDVIHGHRTVLPVPLALSAMFNPELVKKAYKVIAKEALSEGVQWTFSPMLDVSRDPRWGRCIEGPGEDPYLGELLAEAVVGAFQEEGMAACAKHYLGYGAVEGGRDYGNSEISDYTMRNFYLKAFKKAVESDVATVMNSFNTIAGQTTSSSDYLLKKVLKQELGFDGFVISDWWAVLQLINQGLAEDRKDAARVSINAGVDMDMTDLCYIENLQALVKEGKVSEKTIDEAVYRILYIKDKFGLFQKPYAYEREYKLSDHDLLAQQCSDEAMVLLKNKDNILPLNKNSKVMVTGPFANERRSLLGNWSLDFDLERVKSIAETLKEENENIILPTTPYLWDECQAYTDNADVIVVVLGESYLMTAEANSLSEVELPKEQIEFVKRLHRLGKPIIGVMNFGRPLALEEAEKYFDAILYAWHSGTRAAQSVASILYGEVNPSGKLPMTFPRNSGQIPMYYNDYKTGRNPGYYYKEYTDGWKSYRDLKGTPLYPFGYGLSYTKFEYSKLSCENSSISIDELKNGAKFKVSVTVKNIGDCDGKETSQCYINDVCASMSRPWRELKGASKNLIKAGEEKTICFELGLENLGFYNGSGEFEAEKGKFEVYVGTDCYCKEKIEIYII